MYTALALLTLAPLVAGASGSADDATAKELARFQGSWQAVALQNMDGTPALEEDVKNTHLEVEGNRFTLTGKTFTIRGTFKIDPSKTPRTIDVHLEGAKPEEPLLGIYEIDGDRRRSCFVPPGKARPSDLRPGVSGMLRLEWKRAVVGK